MSHFTEIKTQIKDIAALAAACKELGLPLIPNAKARGWAGDQLAAEFVIQLKGEFDVAVNRKPDGTYGMTADWFGGIVENEVGKGCSKLNQLYAVHKATIEARKKGYIVTRQTGKNGNINLVMAGM
jgi:hypothetical protein